MSTEKNKMLGIVCAVSSFDAKDVQQLQVGDQKQSLIKKALITFEGVHQGMYGPVTLSREFLQVMVDRFNREYANPKNDNDYPPILKNHSRNVDDVLGRVVPVLVLEDWVNPRNGKSVAAVFGGLRVDDAGAQLNVASGKYSHVSISFDDDPNNMGEIFEVSFVAVEAARGSQVLNKGEDKMSVELQSKLDAASKNLSALQHKFKARSMVNLEGFKALGIGIESARTESTAIKEQLVGQIKSLKMAVIKSQIREFVRLGKMNKAEFDKLSFEAISLMSTDSQKVLLSSYENRPVSTDVGQRGSKDAKPLPAGENKKLSSAEIRKLVKAQKSGASLSAEDDPDKKPDPAAAGGEDDPEKKKDEPSMSMDDIEDALKKLEGLSALSDKINESMKRMQDTLGKLQGENKEEE